MSLIYKLSLLLCLLSIGSSLSGQPVSLNTAREVAINKLSFINSVNGKSGLKSTAGQFEEVSFSEVSYEGSQPDTLYHIFNVANQNGFIIIAADKRIQPVLGYTFSGSYDETNQPPAFIEWMENRKKEILHIKRNNLPGDINTTEEWDNLRLKKLAIVDESVSPLIKTTWNQGCYYNAFCPEDSKGPCSRAWTGCVATSMAQIMEYWKYPSTGTGSRTYTHATYGTLTANFGATTYQWSQMPSSLSGPNEAVATLMYHCGVSVDMNYGTSSSSASWPSRPKNALVNYFKYSSTAQSVFKSNYSNTAWEDLIKGELNLLRPVWYVGGSHAFICDGYQNTNYFHFNWGWGGYYDGWFYLGSLTPGSNDFNENQSAIIKIFPGEASGPVPGDAQTITGPQSVCQSESSILYTVPSIANATSYIWTLPSGSTGSSTTNSIQVSFGDYAQTGYLKVKGKNDEGVGAESSLLITISTFPGMPGSISGSTAVCQGSSQIFSVPDVAGVTYSWTFPTGWFVTAGGATHEVTVIAGSKGGTISVVPSNSCGEGPARTQTASIMSNPSQPGTITGSVIITPGTSQIYSVPLQEGTFYNWTFPEGWIQTAGGNTNSVTVTAGMTGGQVTVTPVNGCGAGQAQTLAVSTTPKPEQPGPISGFAEVCSGSTQAYSVPAVEGVIYTWRFPSGWTQSAGGNTNAVTVTVGTGSGEITATPSNVAGDGPSRALTVAVTAKPDQPDAISGLSTVCAGNDLIYSVPSKEGVTYSWVLPSGWVQTSGGNSHKISVIAGAVSGSISVTPANSCGDGPSGRLQVTVNDKPLQPGNISGSSTVCLGTVQTYSVPAVANVSYTWSFPAGWVITAGATTREVTVIAGHASGLITVTPSNYCGVGPSQTLTVTTTAKPEPAGAISGLTTVCAGTALIYSVPQTMGITYSWVLPSGWVQTSGGNSHKITVIAGAVSGSISVTPSNSCGEGPSGSLQVAVNDKPVHPGIISGPSTVCLGSSQTYSVPAVADVLYSWSFPAGWVVTAGATTHEVTVVAGQASGLVTVTPSNSCGDGPSQTMTVTTTAKPEKPVAIFGLSTVCSGTTQSYSVPETVGVTYSWMLPSGWELISGGNSHKITVIAGVNSGIISVTPSNNCGAGTSQTLTISANSKPLKPDIIAGTTSVCQGSSQSYTVPATEGVSYQWNFPTGWIQTTGDNSNSITVLVGTVSGQVTVTPFNKCGNGPVSAAYIIVNQNPEKPFIIQDGNLLKSNMPFGNQWYNSAGIMKSATSQTITARSNESYYVVVALDGCVSAPSNTIHAIISDVQVTDWENNVLVYPNPVSENLNIEVKGFPGPIRYSLVNAMGQVIIQSTVDAKETINMSAYTSGLYFIRFENGTHSFIRKVEKR